MDESPRVRFLGLLRVLLRHEIDFFVVGGVAAQLEGAPILTLDLDILFDKTPENVERLLGALRELRARYRDPAGCHIEPDREKLESLRTHLLLTDLGCGDSACSGHAVGGSCGQFRVCVSTGLCISPIAKRCACVTQDPPPPR